MFSKIKAVILTALLLSSFQIWADELKVVVSIKPIHSVVSGLMKGIGTPELLIQGQETPYNPQLNKRQIQQLDDASLIIWIGAELESALALKLKNQPESVKVIELLSSPNLKILPSRYNPKLRDPFFWMDDRNIMILLDELTHLMIEIDPDRAHIYSKNRLEMLIPLRRIDKEYEYGYRGLKAGLGVLYYDTLQYFEQAYALKTLNQVTGGVNDDIDAANLLKVRERIINHEAACLFIDKSMPSDNLALLTNGQEINVGNLDVLAKGFKAGEDLYLKMMQYNTDIIKQCLNADMDNAAKARLLAIDKQQLSFDGVGQGRFILKDHHSNVFTEQSMLGKYSLVFFGYTYCPDVCPTNMFILTQALSKMGADADKLVPYFVTVDPQRDSAEALRDYVGFFDDRIVGLTGSKTMIKRVADQFKAKYEKGDVDSKDKDLYVMDHTASLYLMAPDGSFVTKFAHGIAPDILASELLAIIGR